MKAYLEPKEVAMMEKAASNLRDKLLIRTIFHLGCRVSEALGLTVEDIDFSRAILTIKHLKRRLKLSCSNCGARLGAAHLFCPKCGGRIEKSQTEEQEHRRQRVLPIILNKLSCNFQPIGKLPPVNVTLSSTETMTGLNSWLTVCSSSSAHRGLS